MIASLPMYWRDETVGYWTEFWRLLQQEVDLPDLTAPDDLPVNWYDHWRDPELALSMTCALPFRDGLSGNVQYVGTFDFGLTSKPGYYASCLIGRPDLQDLSAPVKLAFNSRDSQSGWAAKDSFDLNYASTLETGSHAASLHAVASGAADIALIDGVTWRLLESFAEEAQAVQILGWSDPTPALPLITALGNDAASIAAAVSKACDRFKPSEGDVFGGKLSFAALDEATYLDQPLPKEPKIQKV